MSFLDDLWRKFNETKRGINLIQASLAYSRANSWAEHIAIIKAHPILLTDYGQETVASAIMQAEQMGNQEMAEKMVEAYRLLTLCSELGVEKGYTEFINTMDYASQINYYLDRIRELGDGPETIEEQIEIYQKILAVSVPEDEKEFFGNIQQNLGNSYYRRTVGNRTENLINAIDAYSQALAVVTKGKYPYHYGRIQFTLGQIYLELEVGERKENLLNAISALTEAVDVFRKHGQRDQYWLALGILGRTYLDKERILPNRSENIEKALSVLRTADQLYPKEEDPYDWAEIQHLIGVAYMERTRGTKAENIELAIEALEAALPIRFRESETLWVETSFNLAGAYHQRVHGVRAENIEKALDGYQAVLSVTLKLESPKTWAEIQNNLIYLYRERLRGDPSENLELSIASGNEALEILTKEDHPIEWGFVQNNLGNSYVTRLKGDRAENIERAIAAFEAALEVRHRNIYLEDWGITQTNLGSAFLIRIKGDPLENIEHAINAFDAAIEVLTKESHPSQWALLKNNLGEAYRRRIWNRQGNLKLAIDAIQEALTVFNSSEFPEGYAMAQTNLGNIFLEYDQGDVAENRENAIVAFTSALDTIPVENSERANILNGLGLAYYQHIVGNETENFETACSFFQASVDCAQELNLFLDASSAAGNLGLIHYHQGQWQEAYDAFCISVENSERIRSGSFTTLSKTKLIEDNLPIHERIIECCLQLGDRPTETWERIEASKGRLFLDELGRGNFPKPYLPQDKQSLLVKEQSLLEELFAITHSLRSSVDDERFHQLITSQGKIQSSLEEIWAKLEAFAPEYVALRLGKTIQYSDIQKFLNNLGRPAAIVEFYTFQNEIVILVLRDGDKEPHIIRMPITTNQLKRHVKNFEREVPGRDNIQRWQSLAQPLLGKVLPLLTGIEIVYLIPHGLLHYLPLHALQINGKYLLDHFSIIYAPSAAVLDRVTRYSENYASSNLSEAPFVIGYTSKEEEIAKFEGEAIAVANLLGTEPYLNKSATKNLLTGKNNAVSTVIHLSCHGKFESANPLASKIILADGELTAREIMGTKLQTNLITLSACETALSEQHPGDELVGMTRALFYAGARSAIVTLWAVNPESAYDLMLAFYQYLLSDENKDKTKANALRKAMMQVREKYPHPYHWAPFILVGDWQ